MNKTAVNVRIYKYEPNPGFIVEYSDGSKHTFTLKCSPAAAREKLARMRDQIALGNFELKDHAKNKLRHLTLEHGFKRFFSYLEKEKRLGKIKQKTIDSNFYSILPFVKFIGKNTLVSHINTTHIDNFVIHMRESKTQHGRPYSDVSIRSYLTDLHKAFEYFHDQDFIQKNPFKQYKMGKKRKIKIRVLSDVEESVIIKKAAKAKHSWKLDLYILARGTGARREELFKIRRQDFRQVHVPTLNKSVHALDLHGKGDKTRTIPINDPKVLEILNRRIKVLDDPDAIDEIFLHSNYPEQFTRRKRIDEQYLFWELIRPETITEAFRKIFRSVGITDAHFHDIRKTYASKSVTKGYSLEAMKEFLGHEDIRTTQEWYADILLERMVREQEKDAGNAPK